MTHVQNRSEPSMSSTVPQTKKGICGITGSNSPISPAIMQMMPAIIKAIFFICHTPAS